jgi:hypothetical protein
MRISQQKYLLHWPLNDAIHVQTVVEDSKRIENQPAFSRRVDEKAAKR